MKPDSKVKDLANALGKAAGADDVPLVLALRNKLLEYEDSKGPDGTVATASIGDELRSMMKTQDEVGTLLTLAEEGKVHVFQHELLQQYSISIFCKPQGIPKTNWFLHTKLVFKRSQW